MAGDTGSHPPATRARDAVHGVWDWLFPPVCMACHCPVDPQRRDFLCKACRAGIRLLAEPDCPCAQSPDPPEELRKLCETCRGLPHGLSTLRAVFPYGGVIGDVIRDMKYQGGEAAAAAIARLALGAAEPYFTALQDQGEPDVIIPVPLHVARLFKRTFNQSALIARELSSILDVPCDEFAVRRLRRTPPQARRAGREERLRNVEGAFAVAEPERIAGRSVLLVDDVMTTGATLASCGAVLREAGAARVHALAIAKGGARDLRVEPPAEMTLKDEER